MQKHRPSPVLVLFLLIPLFGLVAAFAILISEGQKNTTDNDNLQIGLSKTNLNYQVSDIELPLMDGQLVKLSDYRGRVVYLNFWATWCGPCIAELPELQEFAQQQGENGAVVLAVNSFDNVEGINTFLDDNDIDISALHVLMDTDSIAFRQFGVGGMPTTYIIDEQGMVRQMKIGGFTSVEELYAFLPSSADENQG